MDIVVVEPLLGSEYFVVYIAGLPKNLLRDVKFVDTGAVVEMVKDTDYIVRHEQDAKPPCIGHAHRSEGCARSKIVDCDQVARLRESGTRTGTPTHASW